MINKYILVHRPFYAFYLILLATTFHLQGSLCSLNTQHINNNTYQLDLAIAIPPNDFIYSDKITAFVDHPQIHLSEWTPSCKSVTKYDRIFRNSKQIYQKPFTLSCTAHIAEQRPEGDVHLHVTYYQHSRGNFAHELITIPLAQQNDAHNTQQSSTVLPINNTQSLLASSSESTSCPTDTTTSATNKGIISRLTKLFKTTDSLIIRLFLALILGLLLSLTPCIYPMIPITVGVLHAQRSSSLWRNFSLAISYTFGVSSTFALLGLFAAFTGQLFGNLMTKPIVVITIVCFLIYLAFSMIGFYEMHIPRFLQPKGNSAKGGSLISAFFFGAASGTVASPCLSPGLLLLLTVVSTLNNYFLGFFLLFSFGVGLSLPLLLIGTFSNSLQMLPKAGPWMVEIKKLFGLMMLMTCFYFLKNIMAPFPLAILMSMSIAAMGILEFYFATKAVRIWHFIHQIIGTILIIIAIFFATKIYFTSSAQTKSSPLEWLTQYDQAHQKALQEKKLIFIYLTAPFCSLCSAIERCILSHPEISPLLSSFILLKINLDDESDKQAMRIRTTYQIIGVPTYLLIDPATEKLLKRWGSKLLDKGPQSFAKSLTKWKNEVSTDV